MAARQIIVSILGDASKFKKATGEATASASKFSNVLTGIGQGIGISAFTNVGAMVSKVTDFIGDSIKAASDLNETMTKAEQIFGDNFDAVEKWARGAADAFGQSKTQALDTAAGFAGLFKTVGIAAQEATGFSQQLTVLGSDLASFFNTDVDQALGALKSGLAGESEPLRKFNVFLSETAVAAKAVELGFKAVNGKLSESQKIQARLAIITEQTTDAQGDFARTSDGLANSTRTLEAKMTDLSAELGQKFLPIMVAVTGAAIDLIDAFKDVPKAAGESEGSILDLGGAFLDLVQSAIDPAGLRIQELNRSFGQLAVDGLEESRLAFSHNRNIVTKLDRTMGDYGLTTEEVNEINKIAKRRLDDMARAAKDADDAIKDLSDSMYGHTIRAGDLAEAERDVRDAKIEVKKATKEGGDALVIANGQLAEARARVFDLNAELAQTQGPDAFYAWLTHLIDTLPGVNKQVAILAKGYALLAGTAKAPGGSSYYVPVPGGTTVKQFASGGTASGWSIVGEQGPELVNLPGGTSVYSNQDSMQMGASGQGGGQTINVNIASFIGSDRDIDKFAERLAMRLKLTGA